MRHGLFPALPALQIKYPAGQPALPVGLTGSTFSAVFGANQSMLEALVLKRRLMGPCWLAIKRPRRVAPEQQVGSKTRSWAVVYTMLL